MKRIPFGLLARTNGRTVTLYTNGRAVTLHTNCRAVTLPYFLSECVEFLDFGYNNQIFIIQNQLFTDSAIMLHIPDKNLLPSKLVNEGVNLF